MQVTVTLFSVSVNRSHTVVFLLVLPAKKLCSTSAKRTVDFHGSSLTCLESSWQEPMHQMGEPMLAISCQCPDG